VAFGPLKSASDVLRPWLADHGMASVEQGSVTKVSVRDIVIAVEQNDSYE
jgi:hypothetical protein